MLEIYPTVFGENQIPSAIQESETTALDARLQAENGKTLGR